MACARSSRPRSSQHKQRKFALSPEKFFQNWNRSRPPALIPASALEPEIKIDINFFLDFDFQPLYTFINCGFLFRPQIHENGKGRIETWQPRKRQRRRAKRNNNSSHQP
jgi:hypothetical protein